MRKINLIHNYRYTPEEVWSIANNWEDLEQISISMVKFYNLPSGKFLPHIEYEFEVLSIFSNIKNKWQVEFLEIDHQNMFFKSREYGDNIEAWNHELKIIKTSNGSQLIEEIEIRAIKNEFILFLLTKLLYIRRHFGRLKLLKGVAK